jgi:mRNA interferase RelE/StbE
MHMNDIQYTLKSLKQLRKINQQDNASIRKLIKALRHFPNCKNVKKLTNHQHPYRLRAGRYRVFFTFDGQIKIVTIEEVKKRDENTY